MTKGTKPMWVVINYYENLGDWEVREVTGPFGLKASAEAYMERLMAATTDTRRAYETVRVYKPNRR